MVTRPATLSLGNRRRTFQGDIFSCKDAAQQVLMPVRLSVCLSVCGQPENLPFYILLQHPECSRMHAECSRMFQNTCRMFQNVPKCMKSVQERMQNVLECSRMHAECSRMFQKPECMQNIPKCSRMHAGCSRMFQNACRMFLNASFKFCLFLGLKLDLQLKGSSPDLHVQLIQTCQIQ